MTPSPQPRLQRFTEERQESRISSDSAVADDGKKQLNEDSSSTSSNRLSGTGYSADYSSSSDSSSLSSKQRSKDIEERVENLNIQGDEANNAPKRSDDKLSASKKGRGHEHDGAKTRHREKHHNTPSQASESKLLEGQGPLNSLNGNDDQRDETCGDAEASMTSLGYTTLPQWNGVRIAHPMDPRIDLSTVGYVSSAAVPHVPHAGGHTKVHPYTNPPVTHDNYLHLLEAVRPFFVEHARETQGEAKGTSDGPNTGSSEGFTSFFTTTNSNPSNSSDTNSEQKLHAPVQAAGSTNVPQPVNSALDDGLKDESDSSMVALAPVKRKHRSEGSPNASTSSSEKRAHHEPQDQPASSGNEQQARQEVHVHAHDAVAPNGAQAAEAQSQQETSSSSSEEPQRRNDNMAAPLHLFPVPGGVPIVSESDAFARSSSQGGTSSTSMVGASNTSGSGSGGNSGGSNNGSGSGSNNNSSGSGNEGKGDNTGDGHSNSDENQKSPQHEMPEEIKQGALYYPGLSSSASNGQARPESPLGHQELNHTEEHDAAREKKLLDKKRKRMSMRREYEEQVELDMESSESSDGFAGTQFTPGKAVTIDAALSFSKAARIIVQATPPFLVVHANAGFTRLTGVDSHEVNGLPVSSVLSLPQPASSLHNLPMNMSLHRVDGNSQSEDQNHVAAAAAGRARALNTADEELNVERLMLACGFGQYHDIHVTAKSAEDAGNDSTGSFESGKVFIKCQMGISPVMTMSTAGSLDHAVVTDTNQEAHTHHKRRKHGHHEHHHRPMSVVETSRQSPLRNLITHYVIHLHSPSSCCKQLEPLKEMPSIRGEADETSHSTDVQEPITSIG